jgi:hypothetical protein
VPIFEELYLHITTCVSLTNGNGESIEEIFTLGWWNHLNNLTTEMFGNFFEINPINDTTTTMMSNTFITVPKCFYYKIIKLLVTISMKPHAFFIVFEFIQKFKYVGEKLVEV